MGASASSLSGTGSRAGQSGTRGGVIEDSKKDAEGRHAEAIGRGARDLSWSYAAWVSAVLERNKGKEAVARVDGVAPGEAGEAASA